MTITGTIINYYFHCKRQCWLFSNRINLEENSEDVRIGRVLHEIEHEKSKNTEIGIDNVKLDKITAEYLVEIKKSDADIQAVEWQVLLYLKTLKDKGIERKGKIEFIEKNKQDHKIQYIDLNEQNEAQLAELKNEIGNFIAGPVPPRAALLPKCRKCAYYEYCFL